MTKKSDQEAAKPFQPKYRQIADAMKRDIREAGLAPHDSFLTDKSAGERYGASRITIRSAFSQLEEEGIVYRVRARGTMISAEPGRRIRFVAYIGQCVATNGIEPALVRGVEDYLITQDTNVVICNTDNSPARADQYLRRLTDFGIDGVVLIPMLAPAAENVALVRFLRERGVPFVVVARSIPGMECEINSVTADNFAGGKLATQHLLSLGHRRIAFFRSIGLDQCTSLVARRDGYLSALHEAGVEPDPELEGNVPLASLSVLIRRWSTLPDPPTAVFADNDLSIGPLLNGLKSVGINCPQDWSLVGFDDLPDNSGGGGFSSIHVSHHDMGQAAASQLVEIIHGRSPGSQQTLIPVSLSIRGTSGINPRLVASKLVDAC